MSPVSQRQRSRPFLYIALATAVCLLTVATKAVAVFAIDQYVYPLPAVGGVLASLELAEVTSPIGLALLGLALGCLTYYLPASAGLGPRLLLLVISLPLILAVGYGVRHAAWVKRAATEEQLPLAEAREKTDRFLIDNVGAPGRWGFYRYTAVRPLPPTRVETLNAAAEVDSLQGQLLSLGEQQTGPLRWAFALYGWLFDRASWLIRLFYGLLSALLGLLYFYKGQQWARRQ